MVQEPIELQADQDGTDQQKPKSKLKRKVIKIVKRKVKKDKLPSENPYKEGPEGLNKKAKDKIKSKLKWNDKKFKVYYW